MLNSRVVVLVGNGLSISANPSFELSSLTKLFRDQLARLEKNDVSHILSFQRAKTNLPLDISEDFEELVGTMYARSLDLRHLADLFVRLYGEADKRTDAIQFAEHVTWKLSRDAVSAILQVIHDLTLSDETETSKVDDFLELVRNNWSTNVDIFTLNYDSLLLESMLRVYQSPSMFDMATTRPATLQFGDDKTITAQFLRNSAADFAGLTNRAGLFHLHGSVNFWRADHSGPDFRVSKDSLRHSGILFRDVLYHDSFRPLVLLGMWDSKWHSVKQAPYSLAYEMLERRLSVTSKMLIVGSSMREPAALELIGNAINSASADAREFQIMRVDLNEITRDAFVEEIEKHVPLTNPNFKYTSAVTSIDTLNENADWIDFLNN